MTGQRFILMIRSLPQSGKPRLFHFAQVDKNIGRPVASAGAMAL
jgi:hypothetical protein